MASVVEDVQLLSVAGHSYRARSRAITGEPRGASRGSERHSQQRQKQQAWEEQEELSLLQDEAATAAGGSPHDGAGDGGEGDAHATQQADGSWISTLSVDPALFGYVIGRGGATKKDVEAATGTSIHCGKGGSRREPQQQQQQQQKQHQLLGRTYSEPISIKGPTRQSVSSARVRVQLLLDGALSGKRLEYTHFVSVPLANAQTAAKLQDFQDKVLAQPNAAQLGFDPSIFISPAKLHLTLLMLKLYSDDARQAAAAVLQGLKPQADALLGGTPLQLQLRGLDHMGDDPSDMHVLYLKVADLGPGQRLSQLCDLVVQRFRQAGLMLPGERSTVKLHATVINTRHRRRPPQQQQQQQQQARVGFDGSALLREWGDALDLGSFTVPALHCSQRGVYSSQGSDRGYYAPLDTLPLCC